jgi:hypothetical protein
MGNWRSSKWLKGLVLSVIYQQVVKTGGKQNLESFIILDAFLRKLKN